MSPPQFMLERTVHVVAPPETVFSFFTNPERFAQWWGKGSHVDPQPGGQVLIVYPGGTRALGTVVELQAPTRFVFTYGYQAPGKSIAAGGSRVTLTLEAVDGGTLVRLSHAVDTAAVRDEHGSGWRFQLSLFAHVVAQVHHAQVTTVVERWLEAFNAPDPNARAAALEAAAVDAVTYKDAYASIDGRDELVSHLAALAVHMPLTQRRDGDVQQEQGHATFRWLATNAQGVCKAAGRMMVDLAADGRVARAVSFWDPPPS